MAGGDAEKRARVEGVDLTGRALNVWLEDQAVLFCRRSRYLRRVPEWLVRGIIADVARKAKARLMK